jgi:formamidopyrimidine-DNA glycosylase
MPELPEVETIRRQLEPLMVGRRLASVSIRDSRLTRPLDPSAVEAALTSCTVVSVSRRGKYLLFDLDGLNWLAHLRMTGSFLTMSTGTLDDSRHLRAVVQLDDGAGVGYRDVRRFGTWAVLSDQELDSFFATRLGPEPLSEAFDPAWLSGRFAGSGASVKAALLDQTTAAGVGNIYADEALWQAGVHPARVADSLTDIEIITLVTAVRAALSTGIERQGATLRDYRAPDGESGAMQDEFAVYGREGEPCNRCSALVTKIRVAGRGTWFCPSCQPTSVRR